jgi:hypothetical protein
MSLIRASCPAVPLLIFGLVSSSNIVLTKWHFHVSYESISSGAPPHFWVGFIIQHREGIPLSSPPPINMNVWTILTFWSHLNIDIWTNHYYGYVNLRQLFGYTATYGKRQYSTQKFSAIVNFQTIVLVFLLQF